MSKMIKAFIAVNVLALVVACGGGGGGGAGNSAPTGPVSSTLSFPVQAAYRAIVATGLNKSFTVSGSCSGSGTKTSSPASTASTFENISGFSAAATITMSLTDCTPSSTAATSTAYFDSNYNPIGINNVGINYGVYSSFVLPASVTVGNTGTIGILNLFTNSTKSTSNGYIAHSYVVEADTASTVIFNSIARIFNASGVLTATEQDRFQISASGTMVPVSIDIQYATGSNSHLLFTF